MGSLSCLQSQLQLHMANRGGREHKIGEGHHNCYTEYVEPVLCNATLEPPKKYNRKIKCGERICINKKS